MTDTETKKCHDSKTNKDLIELEKMKINALEKQETILELKLTVAMKELMKIMKEMKEMS